MLHAEDPLASCLLCDAEELTSGLAFDAQVKGYPTMAVLDGGKFYTYTGER